MKDHFPTSLPGLPDLVAEQCSCCALCSLCLRKQEPTLERSGFFWCTASQLTWVLCDVRDYLLLLSALHAVCAQ